MTADPGREPAARSMEIHHSHRDVTGGWLRPAVFGVMDGLVSNFALIAGVAGGNVARTTVALTGLAGLVAGAISMATGEYTSVASQSELARAEIRVEQRELATRPRAELRELAMMYEQRGVDRETAFKVAEQLSRDPDQAWRVHAREELGIDPDDLPSPWTAALSSFVSFTVGAFLPLLPYLLGFASLPAAALLTAAGLFTAGVITARFTARSWWYSGSRQMLLGVFAGLVTYGVGHLVGAGLG